MSQKIVPNLWFNGNAGEAADFYLSVFPNSKQLGISRYPEKKEDGLADFQVELAGKVLTVEFELAGLHFTAINAGPGFTPNPSISFIVGFNPDKPGQSAEDLEKMWNTLLEGGSALMPLDEYPFSKRYGWVKDKYGVTWQLMLTDPGGDERPLIVPSLMFSQDNVGHANEAVDYYVSIFKDSKRGQSAPYPEDTGPAKAGDLMFGDFALSGQWLAAMDSGVEQDFSFNEGISLSITCKDQAEIDYFWGKLSTVPEAEQCGWCKDKYGVSWQVVPENIEELMKKPGAFATMMQQHKIVIDEY